jgi:intracellular sulfur oxidation DsrE/DsrF family protein
MWPTLEAETCQGANQQIQNVQQVGVKFYICNIVARKM